MGKPRSRRSKPMSSIWNKIDPAVLLPASDKVQASASRKKDESDQDNGKRRFRFLGRDIAGSILWIYLLTKIFVIDVDRLFIEAIDKDLTVMLDYRLLFFLAIVAAAATVITKSKKKKSITIWATYVAGFPFVVLFWKIPHAVYKRKSWPVTLAALNMATTLAASYKFYFGAYAIGGLAIAFTLASRSRPLLIATTGVLLTIAIILTVRATRLSFRRSSFLELQRKGAIYLLKSVRRYSAFDSRLKSSKIEKFNKGQVEEIRNKLAIGLSVAKLADFWIHLMEDYRRSGITTIFSIASYIVLFLHILCLAAFINMGLVVIFPTGFRYEEFPTLLQFFHYSLNALVVNSTDELKAVSGVPLLTKTLLGVIGILILGIFLIHMVISHRKIREDGDFEKCAKEVHGVARSLENNLYTEYQVSPSEVLTRLQALGATFYSAIIEFVARQMGKVDPD
jgi:hypothetical protein